MNVRMVEDDSFFSVPRIYVMLPPLVFLLIHLPCLQALDPYRPWLRLEESSHTKLPMLFLGDTSDTSVALDFISRDFGARARYLPDSPRGDRVDWVRVRRRWLPNEDVDRILSLNASALSDGNLLLGDDVRLVRGNQRMHSMCTQGCGARYIDIQKVHAAFQDGFSVQLNYLQRRISSVAAAAQAVRSFWYADVDVVLLFAPPAPRRKQGDNKDKREQGRHAEIPVQVEQHWFLVQLDGVQTVSVYVRNEPAALHKLEEGDILYIPPHARTSRAPLPDTISLHAAFSLGGIPTRIDGILAAIRGMSHDYSDNDTVLDAVLPGARIATWRHLLSAAASMVSAVIPGMNLPLPVSPPAENLIREATGSTPVEALESELMRFATAAEEGQLFVPLLEELSQGRSELAQWAKRLLRDGKVGEKKTSMAQITNMFRHYLRRMRRNAGIVAKAAVGKMRADAMEKAESKRAQLVADEKDALERHKERLEIDPPGNDSSGANRNSTSCHGAESTKNEDVCEARKLHDLIELNT